VPPKGTSEFVPPTKEPAFRVTKVGEVSTTAGPSELASPYLITISGPKRVSAGLSLLLRRGDDEVALGHGDFL